MDKLGGIPGLRGIEHFGLTVPDIDAACDFLEKVIGCEVTPPCCVPSAFTSGFLAK